MYTFARTTDADGNPTWRRNDGLEFEVLYLDPSDAPQGATE